MAPSTTSCGFLLAGIMFGSVCTLALIGFDRVHDHISAQESPGSKTARRFEVEIDKTRQALRSMTAQLAAPLTAQLVAPLTAQLAAPLTAQLVAPLMRTRTPGRSMHMGTPVLFAVSPSHPRLDGRALLKSASTKYEQDGCKLKPTLFSGENLSPLLKKIRANEESYINRHMKHDLAQESIVDSQGKATSPSCLGGTCNVASGGAYLCLPVMDFLVKIVDGMDGGLFCVVGSGSGKQESVVLAKNPNVTVVTFDLLDWEYQEAGVHDIANTFPFRWRPVRGRFEHTAKSFGDIIAGDRKCDFISFDTNLKGELNLRHWHMVNQFLQRPGTVMMIQHTTASDIAAYEKRVAGKVPFTFKSLGQTQGKCCPDENVVPNNMHPAVLNALECGRR